jgi:2-dehydro-3-deoxygluconokinase
MRFTQAIPGGIDFTFGGAEANVAVSLALLGANASLVTALPTHAIADACIMSLRALGVDTRDIVRSAHGRLGLYYMETGANQRRSNVVYDREGSSIMLTPADAYRWQDIFAGGRWFHISGITPALSRNTAEASLAAMQAARAAGLTISCDLNFRQKLWNWRPGSAPRDLAEEIMRGLLGYVDVVIANEEDAENVLGIHAEGSDVASGTLHVAAYQQVAEQIVRQFPRVRQVAITLRESISATHNNWGGLLYDVASSQVYFAPIDAEGRYAPYEIRAIVDRVGGGDAFASGLIFALLTQELNDPALAVRFAVAASCLKHSIVGDFNYASRAEVEELMAGRTSGRVSR